MMPAAYKVGTPRESAVYIFLGYLVARATTGVTSSLLTGQATFFRRFRKCHVATENAKNTAAVYGAFETAQCAVNRLVIPNFNTYGHDVSLLECFNFIE